MAAAKLLLHLLNAACLECQTLGEDRKRGRGRRKDKRLGREGEERESLLTGEDILYKE